VAQVLAEFRSVLPDSEYEEWPRGRVVYSTSDDRFIVYADQQIRNQPKLRSDIQPRFQLPTAAIAVKSDSHYKSTRRIG
jgi:hypothetical protein